jgi:glucose-1-phosphate adenylyltransferase
VVVHAGAEVDRAVLLNHVEVGAEAVVRRAIVDKNVAIPEGAAIGVDSDLDRARFVVSDRGVVVIGKGQKVE